VHQSDEEAEIEGPKNERLSCGGQLYEYFTYGKSKAFLLDVAIDERRGLAIAGPPSPVDLKTTFLYIYCIYLGHCGHL
jgi:hypothetical protein